MGILSDRDRSVERRHTIESPSEYINSNSQPHGWSRRERRNRIGNKFLRCIGLRKPSSVHTDKSRCSISIHPNISRARGHQSDPNPKSDHNPVGHRRYKYVYAIATIGSLLSPNMALAEGVGGVSATANPIANSSGSVTNQAIQVLQGPYITNTYGGGVQCQGSTFNLTPYIQFSDSRKDPWEDFYNEPQYNVTDLEGRTVTQSVTVQNYPWETWYDTRTKADGSRWFEDGADMQIEMEVPAGDGIPDAVVNGNLEPTWYKPIRTDMRANQSFNIGLSATLSIPMNKKLMTQCHDAAQAQINHQVQLTSNKRLDFEIARLKNCGELKKAGIFFHPASPYHAVCADVVVTNPGGKLLPHEHDIPQPNFENSSSETPSSVTQSSSEPSPSSHDSSQKGSEVDLSSHDTHSSSTLPESNDRGFFRGLRLPWQSPVSQQVSQPSGADLLGVWQVGQTKQQQTQSQQSSSQSED